MSLQTFEGDLLLFDTPDGGDFLLTEGLLESDRSYDTAVYLSLFGGNKKDNGRVGNRKTWWGNTLRGVSENQKISSRFQAVIFGMPMSSKTILEAEDAAKIDLSWFKKEKIVDEIIVDGRAVTRSRFSLKVSMIKQGKSIYENTFMTPWKAGSNGSI